MDNAVLEQMVNSGLYQTRMRAAKQGYGLDRLVHDRNVYVRIEVAKQGYNTANKNIAEIIRSQQPLT